MQWQKCQHHCLGGNPGDHTHNYIGGVALSKTSGWPVMIDGPVLVLTPPLALASPGVVSV